ncbi:MAG: hypothetical protein P8X51_03820 [Maritimibacter sp.]
MEDGFPCTYFKCAPINFDTTIYDTDDLAITRGSSLTLLEAPKLLMKHLDDTFEGYTFEYVQRSASELIWRVGGVAAASGENDRAPLTIEAKTGKAPAGVRSNPWNKALQAAANELKADLTDEKLLARAKMLREKFPDVDATDEEVAGRILGKCGRTTASHPAGNALAEGERERIAGEARAFLKKQAGEWPLQLMQFGVASYQPPKARAKITDIVGALDTALSYSRYQQLSVPTPTIVKLQGRAPDEVVCAFTGVHPAGSEREKKRAISENARLRRKVGREKKKTFYITVLSEAVENAESFALSDNSLVSKALVKIESAQALLKEGAQGGISDFAGDFGAIVESPPDELPVSLKSNICVLNMDGNAFGAMRGSASTVSEYKKLSAYLDILKAGMLAEVLLWIASENGMQTAGSARFETLLWGGDEFTFVVPAWKGWELARVIHAAVENWTSLSGQSLTFSTGLAFGPHNAPIRDLKEAAEELAGMAKGDRAAARWQVIAYEGIDRVHFSPAGYRRDWLGAVVNEEVGDCFSLPADEAISFPEKIIDLLRAIRRSALHGLYHKHAQNLLAKNVDIDAISAQIDRVAPEMPDDQLAELKAWLFPGGNFPLLRFAQINLMLDYIQPNAGRE